MKDRHQGFTLIELMIVVAIIAILASIAIPQYQNFVIRAKVSEGLVLADAAKLAVTESLQANGTYPKGNSEAGYVTAASTYVSQIAIDPSGTGVISITYRNIDASRVDGKTIKLTPTTHSDAQVFQWDCSVGTGGVSLAFVPASCGNDAFLIQKGTPWQPRVTLWRLPLITRVGASPPLAR